MSLNIGRDTDFAVTDPSFGRLWSIDGIVVIGAAIAVVVCSTISVLLYLA